MKRPNQLRLEIDFQGRKIVQADGVTAWTSNPMVSAEPQQSSDRDTRAAQESSDFIGGNLVDYKSEAVYLRWSWWTKRISKAWPSTN